ncbi:hypothetical protein GSI_14339 [Ganoderma sinense ZZ0214-1]|uniref:Reverse transcriptase domain-containing protein n=1 Tax=Ganoderma sinense ZZ0214-1 TaxID=1077348 RepID=A0A2G8RND5_9APHY|nr:hypothetical protein GSI_14339 [Ganoderma sinense ZZ0214-1]
MDLCPGLRPLSHSRDSAWRIGMLAVEVNDEFITVLELIVVFAAVQDGLDFVFEDVVNCHWRGGRRFFAIDRITVPGRQAVDVDDCMALSHGEGELQPDVVWTELAWCKFASATGERNVLGAEPDLVSGFEYMRLWFARFEGVLHVLEAFIECWELDIINRLRQAKYFTKFDVRWGYHNVRIKEGDEWKAAFTTNRGLFEPRVMLFGLTNSPATFQALMNSIFADLIAAGTVAVYLDDILIFTSTLEEHRRVTHEVLKCLQEHDLYLRPEKCEFERTEIEYLGLIIRQGEVAMDPVKVKAVTSWPTPKNLRDVRGFLGFANFYRRFIQDFAKRARPLNDLTKKDTPWTWGTAQRLAFQSLKDAFTQEPVLTTWAPLRPTRIEVDASGFAMGGVLLQKLEDGLWHPVAYRSQSMVEAERNYEIYDREMLGIIRALEDWRHYLEGLPEPFNIITDHRNLEYWQTAQNLTRRQARWSLYLSRFNFHLAHKPGAANTQADPLSRLATYHITDADDNREQIVLGPERFATLAATSMDDSERETDTLEREIREATEKEPEVTWALKVLKERGPRKLANGLLEWEEREGLIYHRGRIYIPPDRDLRKRIVSLCHDAVTAGHPGTSLAATPANVTNLPDIPVRPFNRTTSLKDHGKRWVSISLRASHS